MATRYWICPKSHKFSVKKGDKEIKKDDVKGMVCPKCERLMPSDSRKWQGRVGDKITWWGTQREALDWEEENGKGKRPAERVKATDDQEVMIDWTMAKKVYDAELDGKLAMRKNQSERLKEARRTTNDAYRARFKTIAGSNALSGKYIQDLTQADITRFVTECYNEHNHGNNTIRATLTVLAHVVDLLCAETTYRNSPLLFEARDRIKKGIKGIKPPIVKNKVFLASREQIQLLLDECARSRYLYFFTLIAIYTGLRRREIADLKVTEIDMVTNRYGTTGKRGSEPAGPLNRVLREYIDWWLAKGYAAADKWEGRLLPYFSERPDRKATGYSCYSFVYQAFRRACKRAAIRAEAIGHPEWAATYLKMSPHKLRHSFMSMMSSHATTEDLMEMVGHLTEGINFGYRHAQVDRQRASSEALAEDLALTVQFPDERPKLRVVR